VCGQKKEQNRAIQQQELTTETHKDWNADLDAESWTLPNAKLFSGPTGGPLPGPTSAIKKTLDGVSDPIAALALMFLFFVDILLLNNISKQSNRYAYKDFVIEKQVKDADNNVMKKKILVPCDESSPDKRTRVNKEKAGIWEFSPGFILAWLGICIYFSGLSSK